MSRLNLMLMIFSIIACKGKNSPAEMTMAVEEEPSMAVPDDFRRFYEKFHTDTVFQLTHILFPLSGIPANADTLTLGSKFKWQKEEWKWHRPMDPTLTGFEREWQMLTDDLVIETITQKTAGFGMMRRFAKMDDEWMLIFYAAMNPL